MAKIQSPLPHPPALPPTHPSGRPRSNRRRGSARLHRLPHRVPAADQPRRSSTKSPRTAACPLPTPSTPTAAASSPAATAMRATRTSSWRCTPDDFERKIYFKQNAAWLLEQELKRLKPGTEIAMGTATDPYQPLERKLRITRSLLEVFARHGGFRLGIISKSSADFSRYRPAEGDREAQQAHRAHHRDHDERQAGAAAGAARAAARPAHAHRGRRCARRDCGPA